MCWWAAHQLSPFLLLFLLQGKVKHYVFVGSAGAYEANSVEPMHVEGDKRKPSAGGWRPHCCCVHGLSIHG